MDEKAWSDKDSGVGADFWRGHKSSYTSFPDFDAYGPVQGENREEIQT